ncbi:MAG: VWA domain-containing protein [Blautia obeum]
MKRENNKKFKKRKRNQKRSLTCRVLSMMFAIVLFCSTVLINTDYVSQASSFDDMVDMVEVEEDSAAVDTSEETGDDLDTDVNFESEEGSAETYSESDDFGSSDADFSSGENMFTDGTSESSTPTEEAAQPVSCIVNLKNETIEIKVEAPAGVLPNGTQMTVKAVENNTEDAEMTDQYNKLAAKITEQLQSQGKNLDGFLAYNVSFTDADGNPVEPAGKVNYSFTYKEASSPELTDPAASTVTAAMIRTNKETSELELTELKAEEDQLTVETNESRQLTKAAFQSAATAAFTFVWSSTPAADDNENNENKVENGEVNNEEVNADTNTENTEENGEETNTENNVENSEEEQNPEEAPDQEQIKMIRITADEVNLRVAPSTEADVIATVDTDTQLPLLETVTDEDEFTWYKVSYEETKAYVRSDMAEVVETEEQGTENEDANEEAEVQVEDEVTYFKTIGNVVVTATAAKGVLPDDAQFVVTPIESDNAQYEDIAARLEEKAENEEYSIAGFLAYDIYFLNNAGEKINPEDGKVKISMEYKNAAAPEEVKESDAVQMDAEEEETSQENTEAKELSVSVMHFVEENGEVTSVVDMTKENSAAVETNEAGEVQKAEFETESFSTFTITWTQMKKSENGEISINVRYVDDKGVDISEKVTNPIGIKASKGTAIKLEDYEPYISGYGFVKAQIGGATYNEDAATLEYIKATFGNTPNDSKVYEYSNDAQTWTTYNTEPTIYLVYTATGLSIKDELESTGDLVPELNDNLKNTITDKTVKYTWYKSINDGEFTEVNRIKVTGETYNIENKNGLDCLNVAMDEGTLSDTQTSVKYKVGLKIDDQEEIYSGEYNVRYYGELHNGGFETPVISAGSNWQFSNENYKAQGGVWQTTGTTDNKKDYYKYQDPDGADIEIVTAKASLSGYAWNGTACDARGAANTGQFAELNCQAAGALYQDVITYQGEKLNFWLSHRARGVHQDSNPEYDTMYVVIMPTSAAKNYSTQESLVTLINNYRDSNEGPVGTEYTKKGKKIICDDNNNNEGIFIERVTSDDQSWNSIKEEGQYLAKSSMTRFFFVAGATASGNNTQGNFLDEVNFGQKLPPADSGKFNLKIEKKFTGGFEPTSDLEDKMTFTIHALHQDGTEIAKSENVPLNGQPFTLKEMKQADGSYSITLKDNEIGANTKYIYSVEETNAEVSAYDLVTTQTVSGGTVQSNKTSTLIGEKDSATFTITNTYTPIDINSVMEYNKTAKVDDWDKRTYDINITANSKLASSSTTIEKDAAADIMMVLDTSGSMLYYDNYHGYNDAYGFEFADRTKKLSVYSKVKPKLDTTKIYYYGNSYINYNNERYNAENPMIYLNDAWMYYDSGKWNLIKDTDSTVIYTIDSSLTGLKEASKAFIASTAAASSKCQIGLVTFASENNSKLVKALSNARNNKEELIKSVSSVYAGGGIYVSKGLEKAAGQLEDKKNVPKYVILFTDGAANDESNAAKKAKELRDNGITIYTVGFKLNTSTSKWLKDKIASKGCNFDAKTTDGLKAIFQKIKDTITQSGDIGGAEITDVIDSRFELIEVGGTAITADQITKLKNKESVLINDATVSMTEDGNYQVKWSEQTIPEKGNWSKTIKVRAKDGYIGGNAVPTNVKDDSKIHTGYGDAVLPQPTVNVKSDLLVNNKEVKIFYGDTVPTDEDGDIVKALFDKAHPKGNVTQLDGTSKLVEYTMGANGEAINQQDFTLEWYRDPKCEEKDKITDWSQEKPTPGSTKYYLKVTYNAQGGKVTAHNSVTDQTRPYGVYTVNVIAGQIQITKELEEYPESTKEFKFEVTKEEDDTFKKELTISVDANSKVAEPQILDKLKRGTYHVREVLPEGSEYKVSSAEIGKATNCENVRPESSTYVATFKLGYKKDRKDENVITAEYTYDDKNPSGTIGAVKYTNTEIKANLDLMKTDEKQDKTYLDGAYFKLEKKSGENWVSVEKNYDKFVVSNKNGDIELKNLRNGEYRLTEVTAPTGYMLLSSPISFMVSNGTVTLNNEGTVSNMCELTPDPTNPPVLTIKNQKLYSLPESGGNGIYWYMIGGMVLMSTAAWILYKNKCREVLGK